MFYETPPEPLTPPILYPVMRMQGYRSRFNPFAKNLIQFGLSRGSCLSRSARSGRWELGRGQSPEATCQRLLRDVLICSNVPWGLSNDRCLFAWDGSQIESPCQNAWKESKSFNCSPHSTLAFFRCHTGMKSHHSIKLHLKPSSGNARKKMYL